MLGDLTHGLHHAASARTKIPAIGGPLARVSSDIYLCHPFIVHTATWPHRGTAPRMIAQPAVHARDGFAIDGSDPSPVARAVVAAWRCPIEARPGAARRPGGERPAESAMIWLTPEPAEMPVPGTSLGIGLATAALAGGAGLPYGAPAKLRVIAHPHGRSRPRRRSCRVSHH